MKARIIWATAVAAAMGLSCLFFGELASALLLTGVVTACTVGLVVPLARHFRDDADSDPE